ncbi:chromate transporter [Paenibacillus sp. FSL H7-0331]|uniref:chromate transporter n=1 Tax=Paenibacillus sp. FSL H7-0331 TaxID=1920421 RepID=UPI00096F99DA|nr:chromate transporter [Paenibacillus sp. FSL H7-0331]OMF14794.1 chromate transporter [Paenibacillus sp. FSL H7-0331]
MLWTLLVTFFKIGLVSFGGGYAILSVIEREALSQQWMTSVDFAQAVTLAGMAPGPIATNSAVLIGYKVAGIPGAAAATIGMILPSFIIIIALAVFFFKVGRERLLSMIFYGLKPMVAALIVYAAYRVGTNGQPLLGINGHTLAALLIFIFAMIGTMKYHLHPLVVLSVSALMGIAFFM